MLRRYSFYSVVVLALLLVSSGVLAQGQERNRERAQAALDQTEELLLRAREAVQTSGNPQAGQLLQQAVTLQKSARQAFQTDAYLVCMAVTRQAQQKATAAMASARISEQLEGAVLRKLERAGELLDQVRNEVAAGAVADLDVLLETGRESLSRAWEFYRRQEYKPANKLAEQVGRSAQKLLDMARRQDRGESQYDRRRENVRQIME
ncbi:MAG: hypothetical protein KKA42_16405, partial [candidate division Zixibacteria bacterium]|nr:hypothetical protein [candidate division Zixibacteria bacterium]